MREIKFRFWLPYTGKITFGHILWQIKDLGIDETCVPLQYTGLRDKNGKDIYEGDILEDTNKVLYQVIYSATCFKLKVLKSNHIKFDVGDEVFFYTRTKEYSIIGNSFQNPELLTTTVK